MESEEDDDAPVPTVFVNGKAFAITDLNDTLIAEMSDVEKKVYIEKFQEFYDNEYD